MPTLEEVMVNAEAPSPRKPAAYSMFSPLTEARAPRPEDDCTILLVFSSRSDLDGLGQILDDLPWRKIEARSYREAASRLSLHRVPVIVTDRVLPDGDWTDLLDLVAPWIAPPSLIVSAPWADERIWAEVLNVGGYDVLPQPFDKLEVTRVLLSAWMHWKSLRQSPLRRAYAHAAAG